MASSMSTAADCDSPPPKRRKHSVTKFQSEWTVNWPFIQADKKNDEKAYCTVSVLSTGHIYHIFKEVSRKPVPVSYSD